MTKKNKQNSHFRWPITLCQRTGSFQRRGKIHQIPLIPSRFLQGDTWTSQDDVHIVCFFPFEQCRNDTSEEPVSIAIINCAKLHWFVCNEMSRKTCVSVLQGILRNSRYKRQHFFGLFTGFQSFTRPQSSPHYHHQYHYFASKTSTDCT